MKIKFLFPPSPAKPKPAPAASKPKSAKPVASPGRKNILQGISLIIAAFIGSVGVLYLVLNGQSQDAENAKGLQEKLVLLSSEREVAVRKAEKLEQAAGRVLNLDHVVQEAQRHYGDSEKSRREGALWIDRRNKTFMVTLGILNGLKKDSRLVAYDGDQPFANLKVLTPMDVISYVEPTDKTLIQFTGDYYRVVLENAL